MTVIRYPLIVIRGCGHGQCAMSNDQRSMMIGMGKCSRILNSPAKPAPKTRGLCGEKMRHLL